jgi:hypothetical protein
MRMAGIPAWRLLMNNCNKFKLLFDDAFFGELSNEDKNLLDRHLENCTDCRIEFNQNTAMLSTLSEKKTDEPAPGFWENYSSNLQRRMESEGLLSKAGASKRSALRKNLPGQLAEWLASRTVPTWTLQSAAAVLILIVGIFIGRQFFAPGTHPLPDNDSTQHNHIILSPNNSLLQKTLNRTGNFIDRSRVILLAIENFDPETQNIQAINVPYQKEISKDLIKKAALLKQDLSKTRQRRLQELISELEIILLQIANMDPGSEMETLQIVKGGHYLKGILYKIRINDLRRSTYKLNNNHLNNKTKI